MANAFVPFLSLGKASKGQLDGKGKVERVSPVVGAKIITGLIPCNVIPEEILTETSNTIIRDCGWHERGIFASLRISPQDATVLECESGDTLRVTTDRGSAEVIVEVSDMMSPGHISLPNGTGIDCRDSDGAVRHRGVAPNELTDISSRDFLAGTPWHKHIPAKLERVV